MKNPFITFFGKPKAVIPAAVVIAALIAAVAYGYVGRTPQVSVPPSASQTASSSADSSAASVDLAFPIAGRVSSVSVNVGDTVKKGDVLASLDASAALGAVNQAKGALELAKAQYASMNVQYANAKTQQDVLVANAYRTLLSSGLAAVAYKTDNDHTAASVDNSQVPTVTGTYSCDNEGTYAVVPYTSGVQSGFSFTFSGLEQGVGDVTYYTPQALGSCGLFIQFPQGYSSSGVEWDIDVPNAKAPGYAANKNAYDLALATREQVLTQLQANLGQNGSAAANTAQASVDAAEGTYEAALGAYQNDLIVAPADGTVSFVDSHLKAGQSITANKAVISITTN